MLRAETGRGSGEPPIDISDPIERIGHSSATAGLGAATGTAPGAAFAAASSSGAGAGSSSGQDSANGAGTGGTGPFVASSTSVTVSKRLAQGGDAARNYLWHAKQRRHLTRHGITPPKGVRLLTNPSFDGPISRGFGGWSASGAGAGAGAGAGGGFPQQQRQVVPGRTQKLGVPGPGGGAGAGNKAVRPGGPGGGTGGGGGLPGSQLQRPPRPGQGPPGSSRPDQRPGGGGPGSMPQRVPGGSGGPGGGGGGMGASGGGGGGPGGMGGINAPPQPGLYGLLPGQGASVNALGYSTVNVVHPWAAVPGNAASHSGGVGLGTYHVLVPPTPGAPVVSLQAATPAQLGGDTSSSLATAGLFYEKGLSSEAVIADVQRGRPANLGVDKEMMFTAGYRCVAAVAAGAAALAAASDAVSLCLIFSRACGSH